MKYDGVEFEEGKTPWALIAHCGNKEDGWRVYLTYNEYMRQLSHPNSRWCCPCGHEASWDDDWYEAFMEKAEELYYQQHGEDE